MELANLVLPTLWTLPFSWLTWLAPVVVLAVEVPTYMQHFQDELMTSLRDVLIVNVASAVLGLVVCLSPLIGGGSAMGAQVLIGWLLVGFVASTLVEWWVAMSLQRDMTAGEVFRWSVQANGLSYLCLAAMVVIGALRS